MRDQRPVLLVEDDQVDVMAIQRAFREIQVANQVLVAGNGEAALKLLRDEQGPRPCLILLDLNMPRMNGVEFLRLLKSDAELCRIPVIVLTTSRSEQDRRDCFSLGVAGYMTKPVEYDRFVEITRAIQHYWTLSELPD